ncbi:MAG: hypothetical protein UMS36scaffold28_2 [Phage 59_13]|nr:MAG: hypothetical protein UMS36scaffold28_2 [Phage 59_13]
MLDLVRAWYQDKVSRYTLASTAAKAEARMVQEASNIVTERPDGMGFTQVFSANDREKGHIEVTQLEAIRQARFFDRWDSNAHGILGTMVNYIMGKGLTITPKSDDPEVWYTWREFWTAERNRMQIRQFELIRRVFRDGEVFIEFFDKDDDGAATGKTTIRFIDPLLVRSPATKAAANNNTITSGINTAPNDIEKVLSYDVLDPADQSMLTFRNVPAENVLHVKINADSDQKRGEPSVQQILKSFRDYEQWLENRTILNKMRTAIVLIRKVTGAPDQVASISQTLPQTTRNTGETKKKNWRGGTVLTASQGVDYQMLSPNINASDAKEDGRNIKLTMCANMQIPEYVLGDASNQNYASSMTAEAPFVKSIQFWQVFFEYFFSQIYKRVISNAVKAGQLVAPSDDEFRSQLKAIRTLAEAPNPGVPDPNKPDPGAGNGTNPQDAAAADASSKAPQLSPREQALRDLMPNGKLESPTEIFYGCDMNWPEIIHRDIKLQTEALAIQRQNGWIADSTASSQLGFDYSEEVRKQRQLEEEAALEDNPLLGASGIGDGADMSNEMNAMLQNLTPEERNRIINSNDPNEIAKIMSKTGNGANNNASPSGD